jgi:predicted DNA-binding protein (MmcQ/YjbR family)
LSIEEIREYCLSKPGTTESFPFDEDTLVFKVMGKMFCLTSLSESDRMNLKCDPERAIELRERYDCVIPGFHMNKKMWNTVIIDGSVSKKLLQEWIDHSWDEVVKGLPKKDRVKLRRSK